MSVLGAGTPRTRSRYGKTLAISIYSIPSPAKSRSRASICRAVRNSGDGEVNRTAEVCGHFGAADADDKRISALCRNEDRSLENDIVPWSSLTGRSV